MLMLRNSSVQVRQALLQEEYRQVACENLGTTMEEYFKAKKITETV